MNDMNTTTRYVVYRIDTGHALYKNSSGFDRAFYQTKGPATRLANWWNNNIVEGGAAVCTIEEFTNGICPDYENGEVKMVERTNLMTGEKFMEPANTPLCSSPSSETYWSM